MQVSEDETAVSLFGSSGGLPVRTLRHGRRRCEVGRELPNLQYHLQTAERMNNNRNQVIFRDLLKIRLQHSIKSADGAERNRAQSFALAKKQTQRSKLCAITIQRRCTMNLRTLLVTALLALGTTFTAANAIEFNVGPGGAYVGPGYRHYDRDYGNNCRTVIEHHTNRYGEDVSVHRHICD
jgi:hypothetical protein